MAILLLDSEFCNNGGKAFEHALRFRPDLVIVDIDLPGRNGLEVTQILKSHPETSRTTVLMMSAHNRY